MSVTRLEKNVSHVIYATDRQVGERMWLDTQQQHSGTSAVESKEVSADCTPHWTFLSV